MIKVLFFIAVIFCFIGVWLATDGKESGDPIELALGRCFFGSSVISLCLAALRGAAMTQFLLYAAVMAILIGMRASFYKSTFRFGIIVMLIGFFVMMACTSIEKSGGTQNMMMWNRILESDSETGNYLICFLIEVLIWVCAKSAMNAMGKKKKRKKKIRKLKKALWGMIGDQQVYRKGYITGKMRKYRKIILFDIGFVVFAIILFSPAFVGLGFTGSALHIAFSASVAAAGCAAFVMMNREAFRAKTVLFTETDACSMEDLRIMFETLDRKDTLSQIRNQAARQIRQWEKARGDYENQIHRQFGKETITAAKYTGILDTMEEILTRNLMSLYNKYCLFDEAELKSLTNYKNDFLDDKIQEQKLEMYRKSLEAMKRLLDDNEKLLFEISRLMYRLSDLAPAQETEIADEVDRLIQELNYYKTDI